MTTPQEKNVLPENWGTTGKATDPEGVNSPKHYNMHPSGLEVCEVTDHLDFNLGNLFKYVIRSGHKDGHKDLKKAVWYAEREMLVKGIWQYQPTGDRALRLQAGLNAFKFTERDPAIRTVLLDLYDYLFNGLSAAALVQSVKSLEHTRRPRPPGVLKND